MKILRIQGENIASLLRFDVDFRKEPLKSAGVFAIVGHTGAGKSSLLDAMCLALYQKASRLEGAQRVGFQSQFGEIQQDDVRNLIRRGADTGFALVEFLANDGWEYRASWGYRAPKRKGSSPQEELSLVRLHDLQVLCKGAKKKDFETLVLQLVGLSFEQFTRTVLLAQGRFAEFIKANENDRAALLEKLTGTEQYSKISRCIYERSSLELRALEALAQRKQMLRTLDPEERLAHEVGKNFLQEKIVEVKRNLARNVTRSQHAKTWNDAEQIIPQAQQQRSQAEQKLASLQQERIRAEESLHAYLQKEEALRPQIELAVVAESAYVQAQALHQGHVEAQTKARKDHGQSATELSNAEQAFLQIQKSVEETSAYLQEQKAYAPLVPQWNSVAQQLLVAVQTKASLAEATQQSKRVLIQQKEVQTQIDTVEAQRSTLAHSLGESVPSELSEALTVFRKERENLLTVQATLRESASLEKCVQALRRCESHQAELKVSMSQAQAAFDNAEAMVKKTRLATSQNVLALRATLQSGEPCPVCGAVDHPQQATDHVLAQLLREHEDIHRQCLAQVNFVRESLLKVEHDRMQFSEQQKQSQSALQKLPKLCPQELERAQGIAQDSRDAYFAAELEALNKRENALTRMATFTEQLAKLRLQLNELQSKQALLKQTQAQHQSQLTEILQNLNSLIPMESWQSQWESDAQSFTQKLSLQVQNVAKAQELLVDLRSQLASAQQAVTTLQPIVQRLFEQLTMQAAQSEKSREAMTLAAENVRSFFAGKKWQTVRDELDHELSQARSKHAQLLAEESQANAEIAKHSERCQALLQSVDTACAALQPLPPQAIASAVQADLNRQHQEFQATLEEALQQSAEHDAALLADNSAQEDSLKIQQQIQQQQPIVHHWSLLNEWIGSASGDKFKKIAQEFTLEQLLEHANLQLAHISKRYQLQRLGAGMHFGVIDQEQFGELRPVHTLSGGESFIVSLALALGLSDMASSSIHIGSLFIDEGFGSLDSATLQQVMVALSGLHSQGRQVGLITHVEEMKQQIPVRIEVTREGQGTSRVEIVG